MLLLTKEQVLHATTLNVREVRAAMEKGGYGAEDISGAEFCGMRVNGIFVYRITFPSDVDEGNDTGMVYLKYAREAFSKDYYLTGDY